MTTKSIALTPDLDETNSVANVSYNGFRFPPARHASVSFSPEMSDDGRTVKYIRTDLKIEFIWLPIDYLLGNGHSTDLHYNIDGLTDTSFPAIRQRLLSPGQPLHFWNQGVGHFSVNDNAGASLERKYDVNNGPKPKIVSEVPIVGSKALRVTWECSTWTTNCDFVPGFSGLTQLTYSVSWGIGESGITTRTISGSVEIALSRDPQNPQNTISASNQTRDSADSARALVVNLFPRIDRYSRVAQNFNLSSDRKTLTFSITDSENNTENPFFPGIVRMSVPVRYSSDMKNGFTIWSGSVSGNIEVAPGYSKIRAWIAFITVFDNIFGKRDKGHVPGANTTAPPGGPGTSSNPNPSQSSQDKSLGFITSISLEEDKYSRSLSFSFNYTLFCSLAELFKATGLFQPLSISQNEASWPLWKTSLNKVQGPRGWADQLGLAFNPADDVIIDLCNPSPLIAGHNPPTPTSVDDFGKSVSGEKPESSTQDKSYVSYETGIKVDVKDGTIAALPLKRTAPIQEQTSTSRMTSDVGLTYGTPEVPTSGGSSGPSGAPSGTVSVKPVIQRGRITRYMVTVYGHAVRIGYMPLVPNLKSVGGVKARKYGQDTIVYRTLGAGTDVQTGKPLTAHGVGWVKRYILEDRPGDNPIVDWEGEKGLVM